MHQSVYLYNMERVQKFFGWVSEESLFWGEVLVEVLGLYRDKYSNELEFRENEKRIREKQEKKAQLYERLSV